MLTPIGAASMLRDKTAEGVLACKSLLFPVAESIKNITCDNGEECAGHMEIAAALGSQFYFTKPCHSWECGLNERTNGLVRQYFPKGTDFSTLTKADVQRVENKLNSRPTKILGYKTPAEVFALRATRTTCSVSLLEGLSKSRPDFSEFRRKCVHEMHAE